MEIIIFCILMLIIAYILFYSNKKREDKHNQYDAFMVSGIGQSNTSNALFNTRKLPKNPARNTEFYITNKIAGAILNAEVKIPEEKTLKNVVPISKKSKVSEDDMKQKIEIDVPANIAVEKPTDISNNNVDEYDHLVDEILRPIKELKKLQQQNDISGISNNKVEDKFVQVLQESKSTEDIERKKTDDNIKPGLNNRDTTRRYQSSRYKMPIQSEENDIFESVNKLLEEVEEIKKSHDKDNYVLNDSSSNELEENYSYLGHDSDKNSNFNKIEENYSYLDDFLANQNNSNLKKWDADSFVKKAEDILAKYDVSCQDLSKNKQEIQPTAVEPLYSAKKNYERSEVIEEWKKKLGFH